ncbi:MAG: hypothetical protein KatS3mg023_2106 [Armatimonadota bacterium]|nr:MAG: hypothetical protein KatS3mg023_2106 [Armatimonadota bacterium]
MTRQTLFALLVCLLLTMHSAQGARMPRGSFLRQPAHSAAQLASQIRRDPVVAARYEKHFGVPATQFATYAQGQLGLRPLKSNGSYTVFFIRKDGTIGSSVRRLRKGTPVFLHLRTHQPVLLAECGNPMGTSLPGYSAPAAQDAAPPQPTRTADMPIEQMLESPLSPPVQSPTPEILDVPEMAQVQSLELPLWEADAALSVPDLVFSHPSAMAYAAPASLAPLFLVGASGLISLGGDPSGRGGSPTPPAVPEPASLTLWAVVGGAAASVRWLRNRKTVSSGR